MLLEQYSIIEGELPAAYKLTYQPYLFYLPHHLALQDKTDWLHFYFVDQSKHKCLGEIHFSLINGTAESPARAPFGGMMLSESITLQQVFLFTSFWMNRLSEKKVESIYLKCFPELYDKQRADYIHTALTSHDFIAKVELTTITDVRQDLMSKINYDERRKMRICEEQGFVARREPLERLDEIYGIIERVRKEKNYELSMTLAKLKETVSAFPERFFLFGLYQHEELVGGAITIAVNNQILYTFYYDAFSAFKKHSPAVLMLYRIYEFARRYQFEMVDLGTSMVDGRHVFGLLDFKRHMGGSLCIKHSYFKQL